MHPVFEETAMQGACDNPYRIDTSHTLGVFNIKNMVKKIRKETYIHKILCMG